MIQFPERRSLMQVEDDDAKKTVDLMIGLGAFVAVMTALTIIACLYHRLQVRKVDAQDRKYANWTEQDGVWEEFSEKEVNPGRRNPLHIAIRVKNLPLVKKLVEGGYQKCDHIDRDGLYALHIAAASRSMKMLKYIAEHTPKEFRPKGSSPLHAAARNEDFNALSYLIKNFPEFQKNRDRYRETYLEVLCLDYIGSDDLRRCLNTDPKYGKFIQTHRKHIPNELFQGLLTPYRDFSRDQVEIDMDTLDSDRKALLKV